MGMSMALKKKSAPLLRSSPRKRGSRAERTKILDSRLRGNEREIEAAALYRLMVWLSPAYPVGAFSYSSGIEWAVEAGDIRDADTLRAWLAVMLADGGGFCDAVLFAHAHRAAATDDEKALRAVAELAAALGAVKRAPSGDHRARQRLRRGDARRLALRGARPAQSGLGRPGRLSGRGGGRRRRPRHRAWRRRLSAYLQAVAANWVSAGVRLIPLGQTQGQRVLAALEPVVAATAARALQAKLDDIGSAAFRADIASARHETQYTRLFRS